jgi:hypothetical protein
VQFYLKIYKNPMFLLQIWNILSIIIIEKTKVFSWARYPIRLVSDDIKNPNQSGWGSVNILNKQSN